MLQDRVVHVTEYLRPGGGPAGYLHNLFSEFESSQQGNALLSVLSIRDAKARKRPPKALKYLRRLKDVFRSKEEVCFENINLDNMQYDFDLAEVQEKLASKVIVSHSLPFTKKFIERKLPGQKVYIFNHSPVDIADESLSAYELRNKIQFADRKAILEKLARQELEVYERADGIIAPCREALEGYFSYSAELKGRFEMILETKGVHALPTGVPRLGGEGGRPSASITDRLPKDRLVFGYFGRYHPHKGFDRFVELVESFRDDERFFFVSAGKPTGLKPPQTPNYLDLGMLDKETELPDVMASCAAVWVPNRFTYFDLIVIEAMSLGKAVVTSATGGNLFLAKKSVGVVLLEDLGLEAMRDVLEKTSKEQWGALGEANLQAYQKDFTVQSFLHKHLDLARELLAEWEPAALAGR